MKSFIQYLTEDNYSNYQINAAEHILNILADYVDLETPDSEDKSFHSWLKFVSNIKKSDLNAIDKELSKVLASHEVSTGLSGLSVNIFKEPQLSITKEKDDTYVVYLKGTVKSYYEKNYK